MTGPFLVTGAGGGIGTAVCDALVAVGHTVVGTDLAPSRHVAPDHVAELVDPDARTRLLATIEQRAGRLGGLVAAHGIEGTGDVRSLDSARVRRVMSVNFTTVAALHDAAAPLFADDAVTVVVASQAGLRGEAASAAYCASKFALVGWFRALPDRPGLRLRLISPGPVDTPLVRDAFAGMAAAAGTDIGHVVRTRVRAVPAGRLAQPAEIAATVVYAVAASARRLELAPTGGETLT